MQQQGSLQEQACKGLVRFIKHHSSLFVLHNCGKRWFYSTVIQSTSEFKCARQVLSLGKKSPCSCEKNHICFFGKVLGTLLPHRSQTGLLFNWRCQECITLSLSLCIIYIYISHCFTTFFLKAPLKIHVYNHLQQHHACAYKLRSPGPDRHIYGNTLPETHHQNWESEKTCPTYLDKL